MTKPRDRLVLEASPDVADPEIGRWLAALEEVRRDTLDVLDGVAPDVVDLDPGDGGDTIGTVLYHIALVELDWVMSDVLDRGDDPVMASLLPYDSREEGGRLTPVRGESLADHLQRLTRVRDVVLAHLRPMAVEEFDRVRNRADYDVSAAWVVFHLVDHEVEHRVRLSGLRDAFKRWHPTPTRG